MIIKSTVNYTHRPLLITAAGISSQVHNAENTLQQDGSSTLWLLKRFNFDIVGYCVETGERGIHMTDGFKAIQCEEVGRNAFL